MKHLQWLYGCTLYGCTFGVPISNLKLSMHLVILYFHKSKGELVARLLKRRTRTSIRDHKSDSLFLHNNITPSCIEFKMTAKALLLWRIDQRGQSYFALDPTVRSTRGSPACLLGRSFYYSVYLPSQEYRISRASLING